MNKPPRSTDRPDDAPIPERPGGSPEGAPAPSPVETARRLIRLRRKREQMFGADLFAEPAWDMLLDLLIAAEEKRPLSVSSLCIGAVVPMTTALRWIRTLEEQGLVRRRPHPSDHRTTLVALADGAVDKLKALLATL